MSPTFNCPRCGAPLEYDGGPDLTVECPYCRSSAVVPEELRGGRTHAGVLGALSEVARLAGPLAEIARLARSGRKIEAVKLYRQTFSVGLQEAKDAVDKIERGEPLTMTDVTVESIAGGEPVVMTNVAVEPLALTRAAAKERRRKRIGLTIAGLTIIILIIIVTILALSRLGQTFSHMPVPSPTPAPPGYASAVLQFGGEGIGPGWFQDARSIAVDGAGRIYAADFDGIKVLDAAGGYLSMF